MSREGFCPDCEGCQDPCWIAKKVEAEKPAPVVVTGKKFDVGKLRYDLVDDNAESAMVEILTYGATPKEDGGKGYGDNNWKFVPDGENRYFAALRRHLAAWRMGEVSDPETGKSHLAHAACCLHFLLAMELEKRCEKF